MALAKQLIAGTQKHFSTVSSLTFGNGTFTPAQVEASLQTLIDLRTAVDDAKAATKAKIVAEAAQARRAAQPDVCVRGVREGDLRQFA